MAVPRVSKTITSRQKTCELVESFVGAHRPELTESLELLFQQDAEEGQPTPDVPVFIDGMLRRLNGSFNELVVAEQKHLDELSDDRTHRDNRDEAVGALREVLIDMRDAFRVAFGFAKSEEMGFERNVAEDPLALSRQTHRLLENLRKPELELSPKYEGIVTVNPAGAGDLIDGRRQKLRDALDHVIREQSEAHGTQVAKDQKLAAFNQTLSLFLNMVESAFKLAGKHELAARLRPTIRRLAASRDADEELPIPVELAEPEEGGETDESGA